jgi:hypothetical protein
VTAGRLVVVISVVPVVRGTAAMAVADVNWKDGRDVEEVLLSDDEDDEGEGEEDNVGGGGALVDSGPRVWMG